MAPYLPASFAPDASVTEEGPEGQLAHRDHLAHTARFATRIERPADGVWSVIGNGLSNQSFVEGRDGLIAIDTGECVEEMAAALRLLREHTDRPVVAVVYTHFHYVGGTTALVADGSAELEIWGHERIATNLDRTAAEIGPAYGRGIIEQLAVALPTEGPDAVVNVGLGRSFQNPDHAPFTQGHVPVNRSIDGPTSAVIAGLRVELTPAPSDADDSLTIWFPDLGVAVQNLVWPALFNVFAIRGEEFRDPRTLLTGLDHLLDLGARTMVGTHGPPLTGTEEIREQVTLSRDAVQFLWDQTVRGINEGLTADELTDRVRLPAVYERSHLTRQLYGVAEHHVRQIRTGLLGWFDGDEARLFPLSRAERNRRLIDGFGGRAAVRQQAEDALADDDLRWALELASWLVRSATDDRGRADGGDDDERALLARVVRSIGQRTTSANVRSWCLTRALELDGLLDMGRRRIHRLSARTVEHQGIGVVPILRVLLDPRRAGDRDHHVAVEVDGDRRGLHVRHGVAVATDGEGASEILRTDVATLAAVLGGRTSLEAALADGFADVVGDRAQLLATLDCFDVPGLRRGANAPPITG